MYCSGVLFAVICCSFIIIDSSLFSWHGATRSFLIYILVPLHPFIISCEHASGRGPNAPSAQGRNFELRISRLQLDFKCSTGLLLIKLVSLGWSCASRISKPCLDHRCAHRCDRRGWPYWCIDNCAYWIYYLFLFWGS